MSRDSRRWQERAIGPQTVEDLSEHHAGLEQVCRVALLDRVGDRSAARRVSK